MAQVTIFKDAGITLQVINGTPPVDQTAEVATLTAEVASLTTALAAMTTVRDALASKISAAQAALA